MKAFHAYDIRGIYNRDFNKDDCYKIGYYLPRLLKAQNILIGRDIRKSSEEIFEHLCRGINDAGADVADAGLTTTPMVYWATARHGFMGSVMITASHNSKEYNGMKVSGKNALPVGYDNGLWEIEKHLKSNDPIMKSNQPGKIESFSFSDEYIAFQKQYLDFDNQLKLAIDCSNGMAGMFVKSLYGDKPEYINEWPDGDFPGHDPNPLHPDNTLQLRETVKKGNYDLGMIFDGDADRVMFIDETGRFIPPDLIIALIAPYFLTKDQSDKNVLQDIRTSRAVTGYIERLGGKMHMWRVGRAYAAAKLRQINGIFGGELAGHYYFKDFYYSDSAFLAASVVLSVLNKKRKQNKSVSEVMKEIGICANTGDRNFRKEKKKEAMEAVREYFLKNEKPVAYFDFDGYRIEFDTWWFNIRPSNTEPYLRLIVEAITPERLSEKLNDIKSILKKFDR